MPNDVSARSDAACCHSFREAEGRFAPLQNVPNNAIRHPLLARYTTSGPQSIQHGRQCNYLKDTSPTLSPSFLSNISNRSVSEYPELACRHSSAVISASGRAFIGVCKQISLLLGLQPCHLLLFPAALVPTSGAVQN